jgi:hypothetical protein
MNKDALLATVIGFVVGLVITGVLLLAPRFAGYLPKISFPSFSFGKNNTPTSPTPSATAAGFSIDSPLPDSIESTADLLVSGSAEAGATVVIQTDSDDEVVLVKDDGKYAGKVTLTEGKNDLTVTSYTKTKQEAKTITVFYTPEEF